MEISPQYHSLVLGAQNQNLKAIMQQTGVQILFPDPGPSTHPLKKSNIIINGSIHKVYQARQMLLVSQFSYHCWGLTPLCDGFNDQTGFALQGSLPLVLMFDYVPADPSALHGLVEEIMEELDVYISVRQKPKQNVHSVIIKGFERNASTYCGNTFEWVWVYL